MNATKIRGATLVAAGLAAIGLALTGCGGDSSDASSSPSATAGGGGGGGAGGDQQAKAVKYSQCMRQNGVPAFPDPENGGLKIEARKGGPLDPESPQFKAAQQKCKSLAPGGDAGSPESQKRQQQMLKFVECMRKNGVPQMPDPENGNIKITGQVRPDSPQFKAAQQKCRSMMPGGGPGGGQ